MSEAKTQNLTAEELALVEAYRTEKLQQAARAAVARDVNEKPIQLEDIHPGAKPELLREALRVAYEKLSAGDRVQ